MAKSTTTKPEKAEDTDVYILELASRYREQLDYLRARKERIKSLSVIYILLLIVSGVLAWTVLTSLTGPSSDISRRAIATLLPTYVGVVLAFYYLQYSSVQSKINQTVSRMRLDEQLGVIGGKTTKSSDEEYFDKLVKINVENLSAYYGQVKEHANKSFIASLVMSLIGFSLITGGLILAFSSEDQETLVTLVPTGAGIIVEGISALFFYLYSKTVHQMKSYHDGLLYVQNVLLSLKLVESNDDAKTKAEATNKIVEYLLKDKSPTSIESRLRR